MVIWKTSAKIGDQHLDPYPKVRMSEWYKHTFSMAVCPLFLRALSYSLTVHVFHWFDGPGEVYYATGISLALHEMA